MSGNGTTQVLIAGAGPTGLALAIMLRLFGKSVRIVDRNAEPATVSKALAIWSASMEAFAGMGIASRFEQQGVILESLIFGEGRRRLATFAVGKGIDSPYPFPLLLPQSETEALLTGRLAELGVTVERSRELVGLVQDESGVTAQLAGPDGAEETVRADYLVGADGARSFARRSLDIEFEGYTEPEMFVLGDVEIEGGDLHRRSIYMWWHDGGTVALFPFGKDIWRIFASRGGSEDATPPTLEELQAQMDRHGPPGARLRDPTWLSAFRTNERLAAKYRTGRVLLAGDAAHIHTPAGGQGMNTGLQDAFNLGWKLAYALEGRGDAALLLDSYEAERRPVARAVIDAAAQKLHMAMTGGPLIELIRGPVVSVLGHIPAVQRKLQVELSETAITYADGPLVALGKPPRRPERTDVGTRACDARLGNGTGGTLWPLICGTQHTLLLFPDASAPVEVGALTTGLGDALKVLTFDHATDPDGSVRERYRAKPGGWVLIRPDQVIAARGDADELGLLANYADRVIRPAAA